MPEPAAQTPDTPATDWVRDDGLLRDEGVLFGLAHSQSSALSEALLDGKLACIDAVAETEAARAEAARARTSARLADVEDRLGEIVGTREATRTAAAGDAAPWPRHVLGVAVAGGAAVLSYAVVSEMLRPAGFEQPVLVALATVAAGLSGQFATVSTLFMSDDAHRAAPGAAEMWKVRLTEFGLPVAAAVFAVAWGAGSRPALLSGIAWGFLALVFLVAGRLALSAITPLWASLRLGRARWQATLADEDARLRTERTALLEALHEPPSERALAAERDRRRALFQSEVALARAARTAFGDRLAAEARRGRSPWSAADAAHPSGDGAPGPDAPVPPDGSPTDGPPTDRPA